MMLREEMVTREIIGKEICTNENTTVEMTNEKREHYFFPRKKSLTRYQRGQTSVELLLVISFVILVCLLVLFPYISSQSRTNAAIQTKLSILPFLEKNTGNAHIVSIQPEVTSAGTQENLKMNVLTNGVLDSVVLAELGTGGCSLVCSQLDGGHRYGTVSLQWDHDDGTGPLTICSISSC